MRSGGSASARAARRVSRRRSPAYRTALEEMTARSVPLDWAMTQTISAVALEARRAPERTSGLEEAAAAFRRRWRNGPVEATSYCMNSLNETWRAVCLTGAAPQE